jgi:hypothetical protein
VLKPSKRTMFNFRNLKKPLLYYIQKKLEKDYIKVILLLNRTYNLKGIKTSEVKKVTNLQTLVPVQLYHSNNIDSSNKQEYNEP